MTLIRRTAPRLLEPVELALPGLPGALEGLRIAHLSDLHVRRAGRKRFRRLADELADHRPDILALTGDLSARPACDRAALRVVADLVKAARPAVGAFCAFGNHDGAVLREGLADLPVHCLADACWADPHRPLDVLGVDCHDSRFFGDLLAASLDGGGGRTDPSGRFRLLLAHSPAWLVCAADAGLDLMLSGHTHGGQVRLPGLRPLYVGGNHWPCRFYSGLFACRRTIGLVSRGLGEQGLERLRLFCPPHAPLLSLRRADPSAAWPGDPSAPSDDPAIRVIRYW